MRRRTVMPLPKTKKKKDKKIERITNKTLAEHREKVLKTGKSFKYPIQYTKIRLVITVAILAVVLLVSFIIICWWQLYIVKNTSGFFYRLTQTVPIPVASVDGKEVSYGNYLLNYKPSECYLNKQNSGQNGVGDTTGEVEFYKSKTMKDTIEYSIAQSIAKERQIEVEEKQVKEAIDRSARVSSIDKNNDTEIDKNQFNKYIKDYFCLSPEEYEKYYRMRMVVREVSYAIDDEARRSSETLKQAISKDKEKPLKEVLDGLNKKDVQIATSGFVKINNHDGGLALEASKLKPGQTSLNPIKGYGGDGYYFVRLIEKNNQGEVNYQYVKIPLKKFNQMINGMYKDNKVKYYINIPMPSFK